MNENKRTKDNYVSIYNYVSIRNNIANISYAKIFDDV